MTAFHLPTRSPAGLTGWTRIGSGGFGVVYQAEDSAHARPSEPISRMAGADLGIPLQIATAQTQD